MSHDGVGRSAVLRSVAFLTAGALAVTALAACSDDRKTSTPAAGQDIAPAARTQVGDGGTLHWAVDAVPGTLNTFQADADAGTTRIAGAVLPSMFRLDANGRPKADPAYLESAKVVSTEPKQVLVYRLNQQAVWSDGREIGADDFAAQWRALSGKNNAYWTARNAGYDRIEKVERGANNLEVKVTFGKPYADWRSLFSPLYPKDVMGSPDGFNDGARRGLKVTAGPFGVQSVDHKNGTVTLSRNPRWWGRPAKLSEIVLVAVPRDQRAAALAEGRLDMAEIDPEEADRLTLAAREKSSTPLQSGSPGAESGQTATPASPGAEASQSATPASPGAETSQAAMPGAPGTSEQQTLNGFVIRRSLEPAYTQLALNGSRGPLADERVRRAVARALDRTELAALVLKPLGLPAVPVGSHLALAGQDAYADSSGAIGSQDTKQAQALLAEAGWVTGGPVKEQKKKAAGPEGRKSENPGSSGSSGNSGHSENSGGSGSSGSSRNPENSGNSGSSGNSENSGNSGSSGNSGNSGAGEDDKSRRMPGQQGGPPPGAYAPKGTAAPGGAKAGPVAKDGKPLELKFVLPSGPGSRALRTVGERIARMLDTIGIRTEITKVSDGDFFKDHIASGDYDLALYSWPATAFPATDARPIFAKPMPAADGSLSVEQNYTRVGTDQVNQLFDQAIATLDEDEERDLVRKADAHIWAAAGSIPLYQRPQLTAVRANLANAGAFGFQTPVYEDMGFLKKGVKPSASPSKSG
ncbi:ABC transporter family substrate-binding protein [Streptomyces sp. NPDC046931]|uniref:ABC transporter family substrate-binding protein n=1 Tax=Streptomyces sp. NPDC046931 TaxID=3154806 RepID=UPI003407B4CA